MWSKPRRARLLFVLAAPFVLSADVHAGLILNFNSTNPANAQATATLGTNQVTVNKTFTSLNPIDMEFTVNGATGGTQQWLFSETVVNKSGIDWNDYHVQIGFGTGTNFKTNGAQDGLRINAAPPAASGGAFAQPPTLGAIGDRLDYAGGQGIPNNSGTVLSFTMNIPDIGTIPPPFRTPNLPNNQYRFTVRQTPTAIPVPPAVWMGGSGLILAMIGAWRAGRK